jgi:hypothetical protein
MPALAPEYEELRCSLDRIRGMLESLIVRGLRACGPDELAQLKAFADELTRSGASHVATLLHSLHDAIHSDARTSAQALLTAQTAVRLLERLLTLRVVRAHYAAALAAPGTADEELDDDPGNETADQPSDDD